MVYYKLLLVVKYEEIIINFCEILWDIYFVYFEILFILIE